jgi:hypothetical protein
MDMSPDHIFEAIVRAADSVLARSKIAPLSNLAARTIGSLTVAKLLLRAGGEPAPGVVDSLEEFSDALASRFFTEMIAGGGELLEVPGGPPIYSRLVTNLANRTGSWCPTTIDSEDPSPFPHSFVLDGVPKLANDVMWRIVRDLARVRATIFAGGADRQQQHYAMIFRVERRKGLELRTAIDPHDVARNPVCVIRRQERDHAADVLGSREPFEGLHR